MLPFVYLTIKFGWSNQLKKSDIDFNTLSP